VSIVDFGRGGTNADCEGADIIVVYRCVDKKMLDLIYEWKKKGIFVVYFLDDYIFQIPCKYGGTIQNWTAPIPFMEAADCLMSSSAYLLSKMLDKPKILKKTVLGFEALAYTKQAYRNKELFSIGLTAGSGRKGWMDEVVNEFLRELDKVVKQKVVFHYFGNNRFQGGNHVTCVAHNYIPTDNWKAWLSKLMELELSVIINPLEENDEWCHCKSQLKFIESGAVGVPIITSRVEPFTGMLKHGVNGFFASTPKEFAESAVLLMEDKLLQEEMSKRVRTEVENICNPFLHADKFLTDLVEVMVAFRGKV
jgi:hypothetical protein